MKLLAIFLFPFLLQLLEVLGIELVRNWNVDLIPPVVTCLIAADEQNRSAPRIKRIQYSKPADLMQLTDILKSLV